MNGAMEWCQNITTDRHMTSMHDYNYVCEFITMILLPKWHGGKNVGFYHNFDVPTVLVHIYAMKANASHTL